MYEHLILIAFDSDFDFYRLTRYLKDFYARTDKRTINIELQGDTLIVLVEKYPFYLLLSDEPQVLIESGEMAEAWTGDPEEKKRIAQSGRRLEMRTDRPDPDMRYFNDSLYILEAVEEFDGIYIFNPQSGEFV
jgi:hypothetical protein